MHILGRTKAKKTNASYAVMRAAYIKNFYPVSRFGMGHKGITRLPTLNGTRGGYGESTRD